MNKAVIALDGLIVALNDHGGMGQWYLDKHTGQILPIYDDVDDPAIPDRENIEAEPDRYILIEPIPSHQTWQIMSDFIDTVEDAGAKLLLGKAIGGKGAFRRFKDTIINYPAIRERWFAQEKAAMEELAHDWLQDNGLVPEPSQ